MYLTKISREKWKIPFPTTSSHPNLIHLYVCVCVFSHSVVSNSATPMDCSLPSSSVHGNFQARILEQVAISCFRGSSWQRDQTCVICIYCTGRQIRYQCTTWEPWFTFVHIFKKPAFLIILLWFWSSCLFNFVFSLKLIFKFFLFIFSFIQNFIFKNIKHIWDIMLYIESGNEKTVV